MRNRVNVQSTIIKLLLRDKLRLVCRNLETKVIQFPNQSNDSLLDLAFCATNEYVVQMLSSTTIKKYLLWVMLGNLGSVFFVDMLGVIMQERNEGCTSVNLMMMWF